MHPGEPWTGRTACALQQALRLTNEAFAGHLGIGVRTVASWHQKPGLQPRADLQQTLDTALERAGEAAQQRFAGALGTPQAIAPAEPTDPRLVNDPNIVAALDWLDEHAGWPMGTARVKVAAALPQLDGAAIRDRNTQRTRVDQRAVTRVLADFYPPTNGHGRYACDYAGERIETTILTRREWLDLACPLSPETDQLTLSRTTPDLSLPADAAESAVRRIAEVVLNDSRLVNMPLYQLQGIDMQANRIGGSLSTAPFVEYALTMDLLEGELLDALAAGNPPQAEVLPLRSRLLPNTAATVDLANRFCGGGALALTAIARPAEHGRPADYLLLIQERSLNVVNATNRLAVIPKGFHQPLTDIRTDAQIGRTLRRELDEELFGRAELDNTNGPQRLADPLHPSRMSDPMRWLAESPDRLRVECTGFGLNLVSGNYEFASLIVIEDDEFWPRFGGTVEANWETASLRRYSTQDADLLGDLITDVAWSNEGLFAFAQGLRRLADVGGSRVNLPALNWEVLA